MLMGERIRLDPLERADLERSRRWVNDAGIRRFLLRVLPVSSTDQNSWYEEILHNPGKLVFAIRLQGDDTHVGNTGFYSIDWIHRRGEFWILIGEPDARRRGIGFEALTLMCRYGFEELNLNRIYLHVGADNEAAIRLYQKWGFRREGILRSHYYINGKYTDVLVMGTLKDDDNTQK